MSRYRLALLVGSTVLALVASASLGCEGLFDDPDQLVEDHPVDGVGESCDTDANCGDDEVCELGICIDISCQDVDCPDGKACYRGGCFGACADTEDCEQGRRCHGGACVSTDCSGIACGDDERCYFGVCHPTCDRQEQCQGVEGVDIHEDFSPTCDNGVCAPPACVGTDVLPDGSACPTGNFITDQTQNIEATAATLRGVIYELPEPVPSDHGFCWSDETDQPAHNDDDSECAGLGEIEGVGTFDHRVDNLNRGTSYYVRAWVYDDTAGGDNEQSQYRYADDDEPIEFTTAAPPVEDVEADQNAGDVIEVTWQPVDGATGYRVYRDGADTGAELDIDDTTWTDDEPDEPAEPTAPGSFEASSGDYTDHVELTWEEATVADEQRHSYTVVVEYPDTVSAPSEAAVGWLAVADIVGYRIYRDSQSIDGVETGQAQTVDANTTRFEDHDADAPSVVGDPEASIAATDAEYEHHVQLEIDGYSVEDGNVANYTIHTVTEDGVGSDYAETDGYIGAGEPEYQWERADGTAPSAADFSQIATTDQPQYDDSGAGADGSLHTYRGIIHAPGAQSLITTTDEGRRAAPPVVVTSDVLSVQETSGQIRGQLQVVGVPAPTSAGVCVSTSAGFAIPDDPAGADNCDDVGTLTTPGAFSAQFNDLTPGTTYYARAYATNDITGVATGQNLAFTTSLAPPDLQAVSQGNFTDRVELEWSSVTGADEYIVYRDGDQIATTTDTSYADDNADTPPPPEAPDVHATDGDHVDKVVVSWQKPHVPDGPTHTYAVAAASSDTTGELSNWEEGYLGGEPIDYYRLAVEGQFWMNVDDDGSITYAVDDQTHAPGSSIEYDSVSATDGEYIDHVLLELHNPEVIPGDPVEYEVRAVNEASQVGAAGVDEGHIGAGALNIQWQRWVETPSGMPDFFDDIPGATTASYEDEQPDVDDEESYRATMWADGATDADGDPVDENNRITSGEVTGYRTRTLLYVGDNSGDVCRYDTSQREHWCYDGSYDTIAVSTAPDRTVLSGHVDATSTDPSFRVCDRDDTQFKLECSDETDGIVDDTAIDQDTNQYLAVSYTTRTGTDDLVCRRDWNPDDGECFQEHQNFIPAIAVSETESVVYSGDADGELCQFNRDDPGDYWCVSLGDNAIEDLATDPDGNVFVTIPDASDVCMYDSVGVEQWCVNREAISLAVKPDGDLVTGEIDDICWLDAEGGNEQKCTTAGSSSDLEIIDVAVEPGGYIYGIKDGVYALYEFDSNLDQQATTSLDELPLSIDVHPGPYGAFPDAWDNGAAGD